MQDAIFLSSFSFSGGLTDRLTMLRNSEKMLESFSYMSNWMNYLEAEPEYHSIVNRLWFGRSGFQILVGAREVSLLENIHTGFGTHPASHSMGLGGGCCMKFVTDFHLAFRLRLSGVYLYSSCMPSWCGQVQLYPVLRMHLRIQVLSLQMCMIKSGGILWYAATWLTVNVSGTLNTWVYQMTKGTSHIYR